MFLMMFFSAVIIYFYNGEYHRLRKDTKQPNPRWSEIQGQPNQSSSPEQEQSNRYDSNASEDFYATTSPIFGF
jgi:hypothetical protein